MNNLEQRINDLEIKFSHQDELLNELNLIVAEQQGIIDKLNKDLKSLSEATGADGGAKLMEDEKPPHY